MSIRDDLVQKVLGNPGKYSIQQLQQAMKSGSLPAYVVVPIIQDKVQQQKQMQAAMAMQQPPQSTVADQIMQEAQAVRGVDTLPSNLPQDYAHGGIVAFDNGGPTFAGMDVLETEEQRRAREAYEMANPLLRLRRKKRLTEEEAAALAAGEAEQQQYYGKPDPSLANAIDSAARGLRRLIPGAGSAAIPSGMEAEMGMGGEYQMPTPAVPSASAAGRQDMMDANRAMTGAAPKAAGPGAGSGAAPAGIAGLSGVKRPYIPSAREEALRGLYGTEEQPGLVAQINQRVRDREDFVKQAEGMVTGKAYEGLEADLRKEAEQFGADKEQAKNMAIFKAGLAMMAGTSRHALENIGKGALVGAEDYQRAAADIKKAQKENQRMLSYIEQARRAEDAGKRDRAIANYDKADAAKQRVDELVFSSLTNAGVKDADRLFEEYKLNLELANRRQVAQIQQEGGLERILARAALTGGGEKGAMTTLQRGNVMRELENSKPVLDYVAQLRKQRGSQITDEEIEKAKRIKILQEFEKYYGKGGAPSAARTGFTPEEIEYLKRQGISQYFAGLQ